MKRVAAAILGFAIGASVAGVALGQPLKEVPKDALKQGDTAPPLRFESVLQGPSPSEISWNRLRGNVVVLDFWGTWCAPCVANLPNLNDLIARYKDRPVRFIAVGHENANKVSWFLREHPIHTWVGLDTGLATYRSFSAWGIPYAVVVDPRGVVAAVLNPSDLTPAIIDSVLAGRRPTYSPLPPAAYWDTDSAKWFRDVGQQPPPKR